MKTLFLSFLSLTIITAASSQETKTDILIPKYQVPFLKHEAGILLQGTTQGSNNSNRMLIGLQYKKWLKENAAIRIMGGYKPDFEYSGVKYLEDVGTDSVRLSRDQYTINSFFLGAGIEVQRRFYRKLHLFAAVDVIGSYGKGFHHKEQWIQHKNTSYPTFPPYYISGLGDKYNRAAISIQPSIGLKMIHKRITYGVEASGMFMDFIWEKDMKHPTYFISNFEMFSQPTIRLFFTYRF